MSFLNKFARDAVQELGLDMGVDIGGGLAPAASAPPALSANPVRAMTGPGGAAQSSDFDGNGFDDILFLNVATGAVGQFQMPAASWSSIGQAGEGWIVSAIGYFDSDDNSMDIMWYNVASGAYGKFDMVNGQNAGWEILGTAEAGWIPLGWEDFDGDGIDDEIFGFLPDLNDNQLDQIKIGQFRRDANGNRSWEGVVSFREDYDVPDLGDFNGDGIKDMLIVHDTNGVVGQYRMGPSGPSWVKIATMGAGYQADYTGDFNGDGTDDILAYSYDTNGIGFYDMAGGSASWVGLGTFGTGWGVESVGDYNGDGTDDIVFRNFETGQLGMWEMDGASRTWSSLGVAGEDWLIIG